MERSDIHDKILGMLVGNALGDALGAPFEFGKNKEKLAEFNGKIELPLVIHSRFQGIKTGVIGSTTDDNQMSLALADAVVRGYSKDKAIKNYLEFVKTCTFLGHNTRSLFKGITTIKGYELRYFKNFDDKPDEEITQSNGYLMRGSPLVVYKSRQNVLIDTEITNPGEINKKIAQTYHRILRHAVKSKEYEYDVPDEDWQNIIIGRSKGWAMVPLYLIKKVRRKDFQTGLEYVIEKGGDTDTNGAIIGAYLGAKFGYSRMMENKITRINWKIVENTGIEQGVFTCPKKIHPMRIRELAKKLTKIYEY